MQGSASSVAARRRYAQGPRISNASAQHLTHELDVLEEVETLAQHQRWWSLRFEHEAMETRFQHYHEETSLHTGLWAAGATLLAAAALQGCVLYDLLVSQPSQETPWVLLYVALGGSALLLALGAIFLWHTRREATGILGGRFQLALFVLSLGMALFVLALGLPLTTWQSAGTSMTQTSLSATELELLRLLEEMREAHEVTRTLLFLLVLLGAVAITWHAQFLVYCSVAMCTSLALGCWFVGSSIYLQRHWHLVLLFLGTLILLGRALYRSEHGLRHKFLRVRQLMLENLKLARQNAVMQQQLSCHVDAVGIGFSPHVDEQRAASPVGRVPQREPPAPQSRSQHEQQPPAIGESWMENVLRSLSQLRRQLDGDVQATGELDFVLQTLTSEHDLFLDTWSRQRRVPTTGSAAEAGWLSLLEEKRYRRRRNDNSSNSKQTQSSVAMLAKSLRRTRSGLRFTVLAQLESYLTSPSEMRRADGWTADDLLARASSSEELDLLAFEQACASPLTALLLATLESHTLFDMLPLRVESAADFAHEIEARYQPKNPYHNALHAASVLWDVNFFLRRLETPHLSSVQLFSALVAAAVHDVNHPGVNNAFLVATTAPLAIKYSDDSVLERMHLAEAFQACTKDGCDIFEAFPRELRRQSRQQIIAMVLATDLSGHLTHVNRLKSKRYALHSASSTDLCGSGTEAEAGVPVLPDELVLQTLLMMADVGHAMKSFPMHLAWSQRVSEEFYRQGDTERQFGLPLSPLCDRSTGEPRFAKNQIGFLEFVVLPLYSAARDVLALTGIDGVLARVRSNASIWEERDRGNSNAGVGVALPVPSSHSAMLEIPATIEEGEGNEETGDESETPEDTVLDMAGDANSLR